jgi:hypothetical protein
MAAAVITLTKPADVRGYTAGNKKIRYWDITADTGDYAAGGFTLTARQLGMNQHVDFVAIGSHATQGTAGASAQGIGVTYVSAGTSVKFQLYEAAASGAPMLEKTAEAYVANFTVRIRVEGN